MSTKQETNENYEIAPENEEYMAVDLAGFNCNINQPKLQVIKTFEQLFPHFDESSGLHMQMSETGDIVSIDANLDRYYVVGGNEMTYETICKKYVEDRGTYIKELLEKIYKKGYVAPSAVQSVSLPAAFMGKNLIVNFKSGTGKTLSFVTGSLLHLMPSMQTVQIICISSTHEIAGQIYEEYLSLVPEKVSVQLCVGRGAGGGADKNKKVVDLLIHHHLVIKNLVLQMTRKDSLLHKS